MVTNSVILGEVGGVVFEKVLRDKRITDLSLAAQVGTTALTLQGSNRKGGTCVVRTRSINGQLLQPGQQFLVSNPLFEGMGFTDTDDPNSAYFIVQSITFTLDDDISQPYQVAITFGDRVDLGDDDLVTQVGGEQARVTAALDQFSTSDIVEDFQSLSDSIGMTDGIATGTLSGYGFERWGAGGTYA